MRRLLPRVRSLAPWAQDLLIALALTGYTQWELYANRGIVAGSMAAQRIAFFAMTMPVAIRRTVPIVAAVVLAASLVYQTSLGDAPVVGGFLAMIILTHSVATQLPLRRSLLAFAVIIVGVHSYMVFRPDEIHIPDEVGNFALFVVVWGLGRAIRTRQTQIREVEDRAAALERDQDEQMRAAIGHERARIARELHDIVAHGVSLMVLQAGAARQVLANEPERAREPLHTIETTGRGALDEMHRLLGLLRREDRGLVTGPPASLDHLDTLAEQMRNAGLEVDIAREGQLRPLPPSVDVSAYRIVQEALTNTLKHASASHATVRVVFDGDLEIEVADDGKGRRSRRGREGFGLIGMRERVSLFGGDLVAGPRPEGGWVVRCRLPVDSPA